MSESIIYTIYERILNSYKTWKYTIQFFVKKIV